ncbi:MAG: hypothetical protein V1818_00900 [Candidatus Aenigmatarchaeota archaeon]
MKLFGKRLKGTSGVAIGAMVVLTLAFLVASVSYMMPGLAAHLNSAEIQPEWSPSGDTIDYSVEICNVPDGGDSIDEVRIYETTGYTIVTADDKTGWYKSPYNPVKKYYQYTAEDSSYYIDEGECTTFYFRATTPLTPYCDLQWKFETRDVNDVWKFAYDYTSVDDMEPVIIKTLGEPKIENGETWITQDTQIRIEFYDQGTCGVSGLDYCDYRYDIDDDTSMLWTRIQWQRVQLGSPPHYFFNFTYNEDSLHHLEIRCYDVAGNMAYHEQTERVDDTPPATTKVVSEPKKLVPIPGTPWFVEYVDTTTTITLNAVDGGPICAIDVDKTWYKNEVYTEQVLASVTNGNGGPHGYDYCYHPDLYCNDNYLPMPTPYDAQDPGCINAGQEYCTEFWDQVTNGGPYPSWEACVEDYAHKKCSVDSSWKLYDGTPITKDEESCHILYYFSIDHLGNMENMQYNCFFVDKTPPVGTKEIGIPRIPIPDNEFQTIGEGTAEWTDSKYYFGNYSVRLYVVDGSSDVAAVEYDVDIALEDIDELSFWQKISNTYGVNVILGIDADADGTYESLDKPWHFSHDPNDLGDDSFIEMDGMYLSSGSWEEVNALSISQWWTPNDDGNGFCADFGWNYLSDIQSTTRCRVEPTDRVKVIRLLIGGSGTWTDKVAFVDDITLNGETIRLEPQNYWVRDDTLIAGTPITLTCVDPEPHPSGDEEVCFRVSYDIEPWLTTDYCTDVKGTMQGGSDNDWCCVDNTAQIVFHEDSLHDLEYYCIDAVDKQSEIDLEYFRVDSLPPIITKEMIGEDHLGYRDGVLNEDACPPKPGQPDECFVRDHEENGVRIIVADDMTYPECAVGDLDCYYELWWQTDLDTCINELGPEHLYNFETDQCFVEGGQFGEGKDIIFTEDSTHELYIECEDALGNYVEDTEIFKVDSTPPETEKTYGEPSEVDPTCESECISTCTNSLLDNECLEDCLHEHCLWWISSSTLITLTPGEDEKVGLDETQYRVSGALADSFCHNCANWMQLLRPDMGPWQTYVDGQPFTIPQESCHVIEYRSVDLLGNQEDIRWQCVFVDNTPPEVNKTISGTQEEWEGDDTFYENLIARCAAGDIECWKVTLGTTLSLECSEPTHSGDRNDMCFRLELDGELETEKYCVWYGGIGVNEDDDEYDEWCCLDGGIEEFHFLEESQHDLEVKCIDPLYESAIDEEKFKVEGCPFDICLNKKWNLISVPFVLFNSDPDVVFNEVKGDIASVWTYDPSQCPSDGWCVWTPDGSGNLNNIRPGWGYWVLSKEDQVCFEIAGSLMSPTEVPPSRTLQSGWNLIGYYGNTGLNEDKWWFECGDDLDQCYIASRPVYCALNSLVDTHIGFPRWSSLYAYNNYGNDDAGWDPMDACVGGFWNTEYMNPGQGYWIEMDVSDGYAPATNCIWNSDLKCVLEWPGA